MKSDEEMTSNRYISVIYADDLRQEIDGKISIIGMYGFQMLVQAFPVTLPKLAVLVTAVTPADKPFGKVCLQLLKDDQVLVNIDTEAPEPEITELQLASVLGPLLLDGPCRLKAQLITSFGTIVGRELIISAAAASPQPH